MRIASQNKAMLRYLIVIVLIKTVVTSTYPVQGGNGQSSTVLDDHVTHKKSDVFDEQSKKAVSNNQEAAGYNAKKEKNEVVGHDSGSYNQENAVKNQQQSNGDRQGQNVQQNNYDSVNQSGRKGNHKKGHHKSGFHNTYHKDEQENNSSYYDDSDDQGGHFVYDSRNANGGQNQADRFRQSYDNGRLDNRNNNRRGYYDVGGNYGNERNDRTNYDNRQYYNDRRDKSNANAGNARGEIGRNYQERIYREPVNPYYYPQEQYQPKKTITIYEDPRVYDRGYQHPARNVPYDRRYDSDFVHLDFRRPIPYERRPAYDFYK